MRLFLKDDPDGQKAQAARNVVVLYAVKKDLLPEAKAAVEAYASSPTAKPRRSLSDGASDHRRLPARERLRLDGHAREANAGSGEERLPRRTRRKFSGATRCLLKSAVLSLGRLLEDEPEGFSAGIVDGLATHGDRSCRRRISTKRRLSG